MEVRYSTSHRTTEPGLRTPGLAPLRACACEASPLTRVRRDVREHLIPVSLVTVHPTPLLHVERLTTLKLPESDCKQPDGGEALCVVSMFSLLAYARRDREGSLVSPH